MKRTAATVMALMAILSLTACGGKAGSPAGGSEAITKLTYACPGKSARYNFVNEDGELDGYEIAIMKEVDKRLEDVAIELVYTGSSQLCSRDWNPASMISLEAGFRGSRSGRTTIYTRKSPISTAPPCWASVRTRQR